MSEKKFYVYVHRYASGPKKGQVFYVGKGQGRRLTETHCRKNNRHWTNTVSKYGFIPEIIMRFEEEFCSLSFERALIAFYGRDNLCNLTDGGEGSSGYRHTKESKMKMSIARTGEKNGNYRREFSLDHRLKISEKMKIRMSLPEEKEKSRLIHSRAVVAQCGMQFESQTDAQEWLKINGWPLARQCAISACCSGRVKSAYGYKWRYADETQIQTTTP